MKLSDRQWRNSNPDQLISLLKLLGCFSCTRRKLYFGMTPFRTFQQATNALLHCDVNVSVCKALPSSRASSLLLTSDCTNEQSSTTLGRWESELTCTGTRKETHSMQGICTPSALHALVGKKHDEPSSRVRRA